MPRFSLPPTPRLHYAHVTWFYNASIEAMQSSILFFRLNFFPPRSFIINSRLVFVSNLNIIDFKKTKQFKCNRIWPTDTEEFKKI